jgi:hypothetical protein
MEAARAQKEAISQYNEEDRKMLQAQLAFFQSATGQQNHGGCFVL